MSLKLALPQLSPVWLSRVGGLEKIIQTIKAAAKQDADLIVFSEGFVPGYPFWLEGTGENRFLLIILTKRLRLRPDIWTAYVRR